MDLEFAQWIYVAIVAPLLGAIGGWALESWRSRRTAKRRREYLLARLSGLPPEAKAHLIHFHEQGTHTRRANPGDPAIRLLIDSRYMAVGPGGGTYDAIDRYLTIHPQIWEIMDDWKIADAESIALVIEQFFEPIEHEASRKNSDPAL